MSIEAFLWNYRDQQPIGFDCETVRQILSTGQAEWFAEQGRLRVPFADPDEFVEIYLHRDSAATQRVNGITISRPLRHSAFLERIFRIMQLGDVMLFYSDETTPIFLRGANASHYPDEILHSLGTPRYVESPAELLHRT